MPASELVTKMPFIGSWSGRVDRGGVEVPVGVWVGMVIFPSMYPSSPFAPNNWVMLVVHESKLSLLNFCSSERIVREGEVEDIVYRGSKCVCIKYESVGLCK